MGGHGTVVGQTSVVDDFHAKACEQRISHVNNFGSATPSSLGSNQFYFEGTLYGLECLGRPGPQSSTGPTGGVVRKFERRSGAWTGARSSDGGNRSSDGGQEARI